MTTSPVVLGLSAVIVAVTADTPRVLVVGDPPGVPTGRLDPEADRTLERSLRRWVREQTGIDLGYVEQLYTLGDRGRGALSDERLVSVAYLALVRERSPSDEAPARWGDLYDFLPWEDFREGRPSVIPEHVVPALDHWVATGTDGVERAARRERADIMFGQGGATWDGERALERYELLWEAGFVPESGRAPEGGEVHGEPMTLDHRRIVAQALGRVRGKLRYRPVVFELLPETFTLSQLQRVAEALSGVRLHTQNFRRLVDRGGLVEGTGEYDTSTGGRPAELYRFRREVLRERPAPGVGLPGLRTSG
ncbi:MAG: hypothetical protein R3290_06615 [Acidimicrobiia bacterium]|nr:hypothetical protein [Acidimicrobiia bacterium]